MFENIVKEFIEFKRRNPYVEFEVRFGSYNGKKFESNVAISNFYKLKKTLKIQNNNNNYQKSFYTNVYYKTENNDCIRKTIYDSDKVNLTYKKSIKYHNDYDYDIRFSLASEVAKKDLVLNDKNIIMTRVMERDSYFFSCGKIDLTKVNEIQGNTSVQKYEVEFEIYDTKYDTKNESNINENINNICNIIKFILQINQDNFYIIGNTEMNKVLYEYKSLTKSNFFVGAQPETLQKDNLNLFYSELYSVTQKIDGERWFLFITNSNDVYFIDTNLKVIKTNLKNKSFNNVIIDGEILRNNGTIHFMGFDLLMYNNIDIRGNNEYNLIKRTDYIKQILGQIDTNKIAQYKFSCKKYIWKNVFLGCEILLNESKNSDVYDGLIFTPIYEPYPNAKKWNKLLKWKPKNLNTIDLFSVKINENDWELYVQTVDDKKKMINVLFDVNNLDSSLKSEMITFKTNFDDSYIDPTTLEQFKSNTVIEYRWDYNLQKFIPLKTRWDKTINPFKQGNFSSVACSIWNNITNPIEVDILFKLKNLNNKDDIYFKNMRRFHNKIKENMYNNFTNNTNTLLELCVGKGGDLHKWVFNKIKYVCGYDISDKNLHECVERYKSLKTNYDYKFHKLNLCEAECSEIIKKHYDGKLYENVSCQFAIHYFFESQQHFDNLISILDNCLEENGHFMISYMDSKNVDKLFKQSKDKSAEFIYEQHDGNIVYFIKSSKNNTSYFGNKLKIFLDGNNILNETSDEFFVDSEFLIQYMKKCGYECIENKLFSEINSESFKLNSFEKTISSLNRYSVFKKQSTNNFNFSFKKQIETYKIKENDTIEIKDLILHKINTINDILSIANCEYYTYKLPFDDTTFDIDKIKPILNEKYNIQLIHINPNNTIDTIDNTTTNSLQKTLYLYSYTTFENTTESSEHTTKEITNWYIILQNYKLYYTINENTFDNLKHLKNLSNEVTPPPIQEQKVPTPSPEVHVPSQEVPTAPVPAPSPEVPSPEVHVPRPEVHVPSPEVPSPEVHVPSPEVHVPSPEVPKDTISDEMKNEILTILNSKTTIKILKECILKINITYSKNIKLSGNKDELIERLNNHLQN